MKSLDIALIVVVIVGAILLYLLAGLATKYISSKWRAFYVIPAVVGIFLLACAGFEKAMMGAYAGCVLLIAGLIKDNVKLRKKACVLAAALALISVPLCLFSEDYRTVDYVADFQKGFDKMKAHYILAEHKEIDWDVLYQEYLPRFQEVNRTHDEVANFITWQCFAAEFQDGHVYFVPTEEYIIEEAAKRAFGNDYGLALMQIADGSIVAVDVEENDFFKQAEISNGTVITSWDGRDILEVAKESNAYQMMTFADKDNEAFWRALYAAGVGGESVEITYLNNAGVEKRLTLPKLGSYAERAEDTLEIINQGIETGHMMWTELDKDTVALRIKLMRYDSTDKHNEMQRSIREKVTEYKAAGATHLILDLRNNSGGSGQMVMALAELFAPEGEHYYCTDGTWDDEKACYVKEESTGRFLPGKSHYYQGENIWDGPITILVNSNSCSAADHMAKTLQGKENITIIGFTKSVGSAQGIGTVEVVSGILSMSNALLLDENGNVLIDADADWESDVSVDVQVPFDKAAVEALFEKGEDYILEYVLERN